MGPERPNKGESLIPKQTDDVLSSLPSQGYEDEIAYFFKFPVGRKVKVFHPSWKGSAESVEAGWEITSHDESGEYADLKSPDGESVMTVSIETLESLMMLPSGNIKWGGASVGDYVVCNGRLYSNEYLSEGECLQGLITETNVDANGVTYHTISLSGGVPGAPRESRTIKVQDSEVIVPDADYTEQLVKTLQNKAPKTPRSEIISERQQRSLEHGEVITDVPVGTKVEMILGMNSVPSGLSSEERSEIQVVTLYTSEVDGKSYLSCRVGSDLTSEREILEGKLYRIGRDTANVEFPVPPECSRISRQHISILLQNGVYTITDLNSSNGSYLRFASNPDRPVSE